MGATRLQRSRQRVKVTSLGNSSPCCLGWGSWPSAETLGQPVLPLYLLSQLLGKKGRSLYALELVKGRKPGWPGIPLAGWAGTEAAIGTWAAASHPFTACRLLSLRIPRNGEGLECHGPPHCLLLQLASVSGGSSPQGEGFPISWQVPVSPGPWRSSCWSTRSRVLRPTYFSTPAWCCRSPEGMWPSCQASGDTRGSQYG